MVDYELNDEQFEREYGVSKDEARAIQNWVDDYWNYYGEDIGEDFDNDF